LNETFPATDDPTGPPAELVAAFRALSDPVRLAIVQELCAGPLCGRDLRERVQVSSPLLTHHLRVLRDAELVGCRRIGRCLEVALDLHGFERIEAVLPLRVVSEQGWQTSDERAQSWRARR
jgi:ArsR family transcriptional regulator